MLRAACLAACALALALAPAALGQGQALSGTYDPSAWRGLVAVGTHGAAGPAVVVRRAGRPPVRIAGARSPSIDGPRLAYVDDAGVRVVDWRTGQELARLPGRLAKPALDWPRLAVVRLTGRGQRLELVDLRGGRRRAVASVGRGVDLGRPALRDGLLAWHVAAGRRSRLLVAGVTRPGRARVIATSVTGLHVNPSLQSGRVLWVEHAASDTFLRLRAVAGGPTRTLARVAGPRRILWTTALGPRVAHATLWDPARGRGRVIARRWR